MEDIKPLNIAIIIGVSKYLNLKPLPGCKNDAELINELLVLTGKYSDILVISNEADTNSLMMNDSIVKFITKHKENNISELLFYYSGHGEYYNEKFFYLLSDYDTKKRNQTTIENSYLDELFKSLSPELTVKIVDACESGIQYIKKSDTFSDFLNTSTKNKFNKCYFMFSSQIEQSSYQSKNISDFTGVFIDSILQFGSKEVRYKYIIDYISDYFHGNSDQYPYFVVQADLTEKFFDINDAIKMALKTNKYFSDEQASENSSEKGLTLEDIVKKDAERYCGKDEAMKILTQMKEYIGSYEINSEINNLYKINTSFEIKESSVLNIKNIGEWLEENKNEFFAKPKYSIRTTKEEIEEPIYNPYLSSTAAIRKILPSYTLHNDTRKRIITRQEKYIDGFELTVDVPYKFIRIESVPNYPNIPRCDCTIILMLSKTHLRLFYYNALYKETSWDSFEICNDVELKTMEISLVEFDQVKKGIDTIFSNFCVFITYMLNNKFGKKEDDKK